MYMFSIFPTYHRQWACPVQPTLPLCSGHSSFFPGGREKLGGPQTSSSAAERTLLLGTPAFLVVRWSDLWQIGSSLSSFCRQAQPKPNTSDLKRYKTRLVMNIHVHPLSYWQIPIMGTWMVKKKTLTLLHSLFFSFMFGNYSLIGNKICQHTWDTCSNHTEAWWDHNGTVG